MLCCIGWTLQGQTSYVIRAIEAYFQHVNSVPFQDLTPGQHLVRARNNALAATLIALVGRGLTYAVSRERPEMGTFMAIGVGVSGTICFYNAFRTLLKLESK